MLRSLRAKFIFHTIIILSVAIGASSWWTLQVQRQQLLRLTEEKVLALTEAIDKSIRVAMRDGRSEEVQRILEAVGNNPDVRRVWIFSPKGRVLRSSDPANVGLQVDPARLRLYLGRLDAAIYQERENGDWVHSVVKAVRNEPRCQRCHDPAEPLVGILHADISFSKSEEQIRSLGWFTWASASLTIAALVVALAVLSGRLVNRPVARLIATMQRVEAGDLSTRVRVGKRDELGHLARSFNAMIARLEEAQREIRAYHQEQMDRAAHLASIGELGASLAHEIKNPLAGIAGVVQVLAEDMDPHDPRREVMGEVLQQIHRLDKTVNDLLAFARPSPLEFRPTNVNLVLDHAAGLVLQGAKAERIELVRSLAPDLPRIQADEKQLGQVFLNLLLNAIQAMPDKGVLTLTTRRVGGRQSAVSGPGQPAAGDDRGLTTHGDFVEIAVQDTGRGIPPEIQGDIFTPFFTTKHKGTGLGLPISRRIVEAHGGRIEVESTPAQGTTFRVRLPLGAPA